MYVGWVVGLWNAATDELADNWVVVIVATLPGLIAGVLVAADNVPTASPAVGPTGSASPSQQILVAVAWLQRLPDWTRGAAAAFAIFVAIGVTLGLIVGGLSDAIRVSMNTQGVEHPGRTLVVAGVVLFVSFAVLDWFGTDAAQYWAALAGAAAVIGGVALGVRHYVGVDSEAKALLSDVTGDRTVSTSRSGYTSLIRALHEGGEPRPVFVDTKPFSTLRAEEISRIASDQRGWANSELIVVGALDRSSVQVVREPNFQQHWIEKWDLVDPAGGGLQVLSWRKQGRSLDSCANMVVTGQLLLLADSGQAPTFLAHQWNCLELLPQPAAAVDEQAAAFWTVVQAFDGEQAVPRLETLTRTYRYFNPRWPGVAGIRWVDWGDPKVPDGSAIVVGPFPTHEQADDVCTDLRSGVNGEPLCRRLNNVNEDGDPLPIQLSGFSVVASA